MANGYLHSIYRLKKTSKNTSFCEADQCLIISQCMEYYYITSVTALVLLRYQLTSYQHSRKFINGLIIKTGENDMIVKTVLWRVFKKYHKS